MEFVSEFEDEDVFNDIVKTIEKELSNMKKVTDRITQLRVEAAYLEMELVLTLDCPAWLQISEFTGLKPMTHENALDQTDSK